MATNNFLNHENGIFVVPMTSFEQMKEWMETDEAFEYYQNDEITDDMVYDELAFQHEVDLEGFTWDLKHSIENKGYTVDGDDMTFKVYNKANKVLAEISIVSGYYDGYQVIVETDRDYLLDGEYFETVSEMNEYYTPNHKRLISVVRDITTPIILIGSFSNGEAVYEMANTKEDFY